MNREGAIIIIEDDDEDQEVLQLVFEKLCYKNKLVFFSDGEKAYEYLVSSDEDEPFLILSDINMPKLTGMELREKVYNNEALRVKCIPYLFFTTTAEQSAVINAFSKSIQGFFVKPTNFQALQNTISKIMEYWKECISPNYIA